MTRIEQKAATKARLADVARLAFQRYGYETVTFRSLAKAAKCSTGGYFAHWKDKDDLFAYVTGISTRDFPTFCERVAITCAGYPGALGDLADDALKLRQALIGSGR